MKKLQEEAINYAAAIHQVVESKYFNDAVKAARAKDRDALKTACMNAGVTEEIAEKLAALALDGSAVAIMCW
jgi:hypothetical protein